MLHKIQVLGTARRQVCTIRRVVVWLKNKIYGSSVTFWSNYHSLSMNLDERDDEESNLGVSGGGLTPPGLPGWLPLAHSMSTQVC